MTLQQEMREALTAVESKYEKDRMKWIDARKDHENEANEILEILLDEIGNHSFESDSLPVMGTTCGTYKLVARIDSEGLYCKKNYFMHTALFTAQGVIQFVFKTLLPILDEREKGSFTGIDDPRFYELNGGTDKMGTIVNADY